MIPISVSHIGFWAFGGCPILTIFAEAPTRPAGWEWQWNPDNRPVVWGHVVSEDDIVESVYVSSLLGNYPNPFNPETVVRYTVVNDAFVTIEIYNIKGQKVRSLVNDFVNRGKHDVVWNGRDHDGRKVSSGLYFYKMTAGKYQSVRRMVLMK